MGHGMSLSKTYPVLPVGHVQPVNPVGPVHPVQMTGPDRADRATGCDNAQQAASAFARLAQALATTPLMAPPWKPTWLLRAPAPRTTKGSPE